MAEVAGSNPAAPTIQPWVPPSRKDDDDARAARFGSSRAGYRERDNLPETQDRYTKSKRGHPPEPHLMTQTNDLTRRLAAEFVGTALLLAVVVGSGIMGERLADGNAAIALLGNTIATGAILVVLILMFGPVSGAHFNPAVTLSFLLQREISRLDALAFVAVQVAGAVAGVWLAHLMFSEPVIMVGTKARTGLGQWVAEAVATFGLVATIVACVRTRPQVVPFAVGLFITAGYWFTSSTSFANPAVTFGRSFTDTFSGIRPMDAPAFIAFQIAGAIIATAFCVWLFRRTAPPADE